MSLKNVRFDWNRHEAKAHIPNDANEDEKNDDDDSDESFTVPEKQLKMNRLFVWIQERSALD